MSRALKPPLRVVVALTTFSLCAQGCGGQCCSNPRFSMSGCFSSAQQLRLGSTIELRVDPTGVEGGSQTLFSGAKGCDGNTCAAKEVEWASSNPSVATVSQAGSVATVRGVAPGTSNISAMVTTAVSGVSVFAVNVVMVGNRLEDQASCPITVLP